MDRHAYLKARREANKLIPKDVQLKIIKARLAAVQYEGEEGDGELPVDE